jgi:hypothetical protein
MRALALNGSMLDAAVASVEKIRVWDDYGREWTAGPAPDRMWLHHANGTRELWHPSTNYAQGAPYIERDQIFIDPPHDVHIANMRPDGTISGIWRSEYEWHATVSARTRTYPNPHDPELPGCVGRGQGPTMLIAALNALVASYGIAHNDEGTRSVTSALLK